MRALSKSEQALLDVVRSNPGITVADARRLANIGQGASRVFGLRKLGLLKPTTPADHPDYGRLFPADWEGVVTPCLDGEPVKRVKAPRPSTGRPRGRPTTGLLTVACTKCGALVSFMCRTASGKILAAGHEERRALAGLDPRKKWKPADAEKSDTP